MSGRAKKNDIKHFDAVKGRVKVWVKGKLLGSC
jgi:hypothetical protein